MAKSSEQTTPKDQAEELRRNPHRTAQVSTASEWRLWVRYEPPIGAYEIAKVSSPGQIEATPCSTEDVLNLLAESAAEIKPITQALYTPPESQVWAHVWKAVDERLDNVVYRSES